MKKKVLVVGAGSGIGKSLLNEINKDSSIEGIGISRRGNFFSNTDSLKYGENYFCDLYKEETILKFTQYLKNQIQTLDSVYLCQGDGYFGNLESIDSRKLMEHFQLNVFSNFILLRELFPILKNTQNPFVCILSSTAGKIGFTESTAYCASKHSIAGFAKALREEWKEFLIRVFLVSPGAISTDIWKNREGFATKDMISPEEFAIYLKSFIYLPKSINLEDSYVLPLKGIL
jgi:short-subunit dehydrogenase